MLQKISISKQCYSFELSFHPIILKKKTVSTKTYEAAQQFVTLIIRNVYWAVNQGIRMISERSRDTENSALITEINYILKEKESNQINEAWLE